MADYGHARIKIGGEFPEGLLDGFLKLLSSEGLIGDTTDKHCLFRYVDPKTGLLCFESGNALDGVFAGLEDWLQANNISYDRWSASILGCDSILTKHRAGHIYRCYTNMDGTPILTLNELRYLNSKGRLNITDIERCLHENVAPLEPWNITGSSKTAELLSM